jgi:triphosphatase
MKSLPRELEIKLELTARQARRLGAKLAAGDGEQCVATLRSIYFDTSQWALREKGLALRIRRVGDTWVQTVKLARAKPFKSSSGRVHQHGAISGSAISAGVSNPVELEAEVASCDPDIDAIADKKLRNKISKLAAASPLVVVFETIVERTSQRLTTPTGETMEVVLDLGTIEAGARQEKVREAEIEWLGGSPAGLLTAIPEVVGDGPLRPAALSKADRGFRLLGESTRPPALAAKAEPLALEPGSTAAQAFSEILGSVADHVLHNWQALEETGEAEAAHQMRVGLRRLRAALRILRSAGDPGEGTRALERTVRDLGRIVGQVRDIDVLREDIVAPLAGHAHVERGIAAIQRQLARERKTRLEAAIADLGSMQHGLARIEIGLLPHDVNQLAGGKAGSLDGTVEDLARTALRKLLRRVTKRARGLADLSIEERHELRKSVKPLRYAAEFFASLLPADKTKRMLECTADLQTTLGYLNDVALADGLVELIGGEQASLPEVSRAIGAVIGWHSAKAEEAWGDVEKTWKRFEKAVPFLE